ncbi:CAP domain-containing protein [Rubrivivax albus]|nr:CAP domain-containing protein [Rubrivivax albus]
MPILSAEPISSPLAPEAEMREQDLLRAVNDYRAAQGLARWRGDPGLAAIARAHSRRMAREGRLSHEGFRQRALLAGSLLCVENLVAGHAVPEQAVAMWRRSPAHHANLLDGRVAWAGVGVAGRFATLLACATPVAPVADAVLPEGVPDAGRESGTPPALDPRR